MKFTERQLQVDLEVAGGQMANILFNVSQRPGEQLAPHVAESMDAARRAWDLAVGRVRQAKHLTALAPSTTLNIEQVRKDFQEGTLICRATIGLLIDALSAPADLQSIEQYRMQMAGISTAAIGYWTEAESIHPDYDTVALRDVAKLYAKYDALYKAAQHADDRAPLSIVATVYSSCSVVLREAGQAYPRTCAECGLGPCKMKGGR